MSTCKDCCYFNGIEEECVNVDSDRWTTHANETACDKFSVTGFDGPPRLPPPAQRVQQTEDAIDRQKLNAQLDRLTREHTRYDWRQPTTHLDRSAKDA